MLNKLKWLNSKAATSNTVNTTDITMVKINNLPFTSTPKRVARIIHRL